MVRPNIFVDDKYKLGISGVYKTDVDALARFPMFQHRRDLAVIGDHHARKLPIL